MGPNLRHVFLLLDQLPRIEHDLLEAGQPLLKAAHLLDVRLVDEREHRVTFHQHRLLHSLVELSTTMYNLQRLRLLRGSILGIDGRRSRGNGNLEKESDKPYLLETRLTLLDHLLEGITSILQSLKMNAAQTDSKL